MRLGTVGPGEPFAKPGLAGRCRIQAKVRRPCFCSPGGLWAKRSFVRLVQLRRFQRLRMFETPPCAPPKGFRRAHEPTAALGPAETTQVGELIKQLKSEGLGIFLISHDIHDVFDLADRVTVMKNGQVVGTGRVQDMTKDEVLGMIILGKCPPGAIPGPGAMALAS